MIFDCVSLKGALLNVHCRRSLLCTSILLTNHISVLLVHDYHLAMLTSYRMVEVNPAPLW